MKKKLLEVAERILSVMLSVFACLGMFLVFIFVIGLFATRTLTHGEMISVGLVSMFLTYCLTQGLMYVRYQRLEILADELEQQKDEQAEELYDHLMESVYDGK